MFKRIVAIALVFTTTWISTWAAAPGWAQGSPQAGSGLSITPNEAAELVQRWSQLLHELRDHTDKSQFDLSALLDKCNHDAEKIISFVKTQVSFQQYPGVLRGATGTLSSRSGNSLDQSLLLATLLKDAGFEAVIARTRLVSKQKEELVREISRQSSLEPVLFSPTAQPTLDRLQALAETINRKLGVAPDTGSPTVETRSVREVADLHYQFLRSGLDRNGISLDTMPITAEFMVEASDYFWVRYRGIPSDPWKTVHPSFSETPSFAQALIPAETIADTVPPELHQSITLQAFAKRRFGSQLETIPLMLPWKRPVAALVDTPISYSNGFTASADWSADDPLKDSTLFIPQLGDVSAPGAIAFNVKGDTAPASEAFSPMSGIFQQVGDKTRSAASALSQLGASQPDESAPESVTALEEVWLEITLDTPTNDNPKKWKRFFRGKTEGALAPSHLAQKITLNFVGGSVAPAKLMDRWLLRHATTLELALDQHRAANGDLRVDPGEVLEKLKIYDEQVLFKMMINLPATKDLSGITYRHEPLVVAQHRPLVVDPGLVSGIDIVHNARRSFQVGQDGFPELAPSISLLEGVWETVSEALVMRFGAEKTHDTVGTFEETVNKGLAPRTLTRASDSTTIPNLPMQSRELIERSLEHKQVIILPPAEETSIDALAWWRINPLTGETLGILENGWGGQQLIEYSPQRVAGLTNCVVVTFLSCSVIAKFVRAELGILLAAGYDWTFVAAIVWAFTGGQGGELPPDFEWNPSDDPIAGWPLKKLLDYLEAKVFAYCVEAMFPHCVLHFVP